MKNLRKISGRKHYGISLNKDLMVQMQYLAIDKDCYTNELIEEAMKDLLEKYKNLTDSTRRGRHE